MNKTNSKVFRNIKGLLSACQDLTPEFFISRENIENIFTKEEIYFHLIQLESLKEEGKLSDVWEKVIRHALLPTLNESLYRPLTDILMHKPNQLKKVISEITDYLYFLETDKDEFSKH